MALAPVLPLFKIYIYPQFDELFDPHTDPRWPRVQYQESWMIGNKRELKDNKTEAMIMLSDRMSVDSPLPSGIHIGDADVPCVSYV